MPKACRQQAALTQAEILNDADTVRQTVPSLCRIVIKRRNPQTQRGQGFRTLPELLRPGGEVAHCSRLPYTHPTAASFWQSFRLLILPPFVVADTQVRFGAVPLLALQPLFSGTGQKAGYLGATGLRTGLLPGRRSTPTGHAHSTTLLPQSNERGIAWHGNWNMKHVSWWARTGGKDRGPSRSCSLISAALRGSWRRNHYRASGI